MLMPHSLQKGSLRAKLPSPSAPDRRSAAERSEVRREAVGFQFQPKRLSMQSIPSQCPHPKCSFPFRPHLATKFPEYPELLTEVQIKVSVELVVELPAHVETLPTQTAGNSAVRDGMYNLVFRLDRLDPLVNDLRAVRRLENFHDQFRLVPRQQN